jgi:hypothetical protein
MNLVGVMVAQLPSGRWKGYVWGQPASHVSDWRGCNYRRATIPDQPARGFATEEEADAWVRQRFPTKDDAREWARKAGNGSSLADAFFAAPHADVDLAEKTHPVLHVRVTGPDGTECRARVVAVRVVAILRVGRKERSFSRTTGRALLRDADSGLEILAEDLPILEKW